LSQSYQVEDILNRIEDVSESSEIECIAVVIVTDGHVDFLVGGHKVQPDLMLQGFCEIGKMIIAEGKKQGHTPEPGSVH
jgi:hypothetical protein